MNHENYIIKVFEPQVLMPKVVNIEIVRGNLILKRIQELKQNGALISVHILGKCVLDWS